VERSFSAEIRSLSLGAGETFHGEGILAVTKALLQSGVSYVGGYQGAPVSHLLDVMVQARDYMDELGVHVEACTNEASAAAMLGASIMYPVRGAVTWKSVVGTNVASDALSNLASPGVMGGAMIMLAITFSIQGMSDAPATDGSLADISDQSRLLLASYALGLVIHFFLNGRFRTASPVGEMIQPLAHLLVLLVMIMPITMHLLPSYPHLDQARYVALTVVTVKFLGDVLFTRIHLSRIWTP